MPWPFPAGRTVLVVNRIADQRTQQREADPDRTYLVEGCAFNPGGSTETSTAGGTGSITQPTVYGPYDLDVDVNAQITVDGVEWEADGEVLRWRNDLTGTEACSEIRLQRKAGAV